MRLKVHIDDLLDFYELLIAKALDPKTDGRALSPYAKFYIIESGKHTWRELAEAVAQALFKRGLVSTTEITQLSAEEAVKLHHRA